MRLGILDVYANASTSDDTSISSGPSTSRPSLDSEMECSEIGPSSFPLPVCRVF